MSMLTAVVLVALAFATWLAVPGGVVQWISFGTDTGAALQRMLVPVGVVLLPFAGWLEVQGLHRGWYSATFGAALLMSFAGIVVCAVGYRVAGTALSADRERDTLLDELHRVNAQLEDRVRTRSHQLNRQRTKLALFEERDRIARDLHDRVIQRVFAAGLQVAALGRTTRKEALARGVDPMIADSLDLVATELDLAIRELRNSIFELTSVADHDNVEQVVHDIAARAARILGFMPRVEVGGATAGVRPDLVAQLASVVQEALSNIARHAAASTAEVMLVVDDRDLELRITDDGVGVPDPLPRSSGITNIQNRARALGGTAAWMSAQPRGTVMVWRVPRDEVASDVAEASGAHDRAEPFGVAGAVQQVSSAN
jgi:signal transduction histidine kinase